MKNKSQMQISENRVIKNQRRLDQLGQELLKSRKSKKSTQKDRDELKQTIEMFTKVSSGVGYLGQTLTSMKKTGTHAERLEILHESLVLMREILPPEIFEKYWDKAHTTVIEKRKN